MGKKKFHPLGLFSEQIFGPLKNYTCQCGSGIYWGASRAGDKCNDCKVRIVKSDERRKQFAKIILPIPVVNPLFYDLVVSIGGKAFKKGLDDLMKNDKSVLYFDGEDYVITHQEKVPPNIPKWEKLEAIHQLVYGVSKQMVEDGETQWKKVFDNIDNFLIDKVIVLPPDLRPTSKTGNEARQLMDKINRNYVQILTKKEIMRETIIDVHKDKSLFYSYFKQLQKDVNDVYNQILEKLSKKEGLIRGNILGKRIDFSGRAVIVPDPTLNLDECKIPYIMALEIFKLPIAKRIVELGKFKLLNQAIDFVDECIEKHSESLVAVCEEIIKDEVCILNRQPSLHRLGMLGFKLRITLDLVIKIHPLVCNPFNADFDGDQMAVYVPISEKAKEEIRQKISVIKNLSSPSNESLTTTPNQDIVLGIYYLTSDDFNDLAEPVEFKGELLSAAKVEFNKCLPDDYPVIKYKVDKKKLIGILTDIKDKYPDTVTAKVLDNVKRIGFKYATLFGFTLSLDRLEVPGSQALKDEAYSKPTIREQLNALNQPEITAFLKKNFHYSYLIESGARGTWDQAKQLILSRGFISNFNGEILPIPIKGSQLDGLTEEEFFYSTYGSRKGLLDVALNTGTSGYLSRKLIFTCANLQYDYHLDDCGTKDFLEVEVNSKRKALMLAGRYMKLKDNTLQLITKENCFSLIDKSIEIRSPIFCKSPKLCQKCYGDLGKKLNSRFVGIVAAQTLGERGTQLVLRTFHTSGSAIIKDSQSSDVSMKQEDIIGDLASVSELLHKFKDKKPQDIVAELFQAYDKDIYHVHFECVVAQLMWVEGKKWRLLDNRNKIEPQYFSVQSVPAQESWILAMAFSNPKRSILHGIQDEGKYQGVMDQILKGELIDEGSEADQAGLKIDPENLGEIPGLETDAAIG
jgi:DNA-directed RNA polymerase subunit beta'